MNGVGLLIPISFRVPLVCVFTMFSEVGKEKDGKIGIEGSRGFRESSRNEAASSGSESQIGPMLTSSLSTCSSKDILRVSHGPSSVSVYVDSSEVLEYCAEKVLPVL